MYKKCKGKDRCMKNLDSSKRYLQLTLSARTSMRPEWLSFWYDFISSSMTANPSSSVNEIIFSVGVLVQPFWLEGITILNRHFYLLSLSRVFGTITESDLWKKNPKSSLVTSQLGLRQWKLYVQIQCQLGYQRVRKWTVQNCFKMTFCETGRPKNQKLDVPECSNWTVIRGQNGPFQEMKMNDVKEWKWTVQKSKSWWSQELKWTVLRN